MEGHPNQNRRFWEVTRPENLPKGCPEGGPKTRPENDTKKSLSGDMFLVPWGASWPDLDVFCCYVPACWPQGSKKGGPREARSRPRAAQEAEDRPRGSEECPRRTKETLRRGQKGTKAAPREPLRAAGGGRGGHCASL